MPPPLRKIVGGRRGAFGGLYTPDGAPLPAADFIWIKITGQDAETGLCAFTEQWFDAEGDFFDRPGGLTGTVEGVGTGSDAAKTWNPAREVNDQKVTAFPFYTRAWRTVEATAEGTGSASGSLSGTDNTPIGTVFRFSIGGDGSFLVVLTAKDYDAYWPWILYSGYRVSASFSQGSGSGSGSASGGGGGITYELGDPVDLPIFHLHRELDLPVWDQASASSAAGGSSGWDVIPAECVYKVFRGPGDWYFLNDQPRAAFVAVNGEADGEGVLPGVLLAWHQANDEVVALKEIRVIDINAFV
jgi:hypothetical protein